MDEPFGALDASRATALHEELERIWTETGLTILFVTHNAREAVRRPTASWFSTSRPAALGQRSGSTFPAHAASTHPSWR